MKSEIKQQWPQIKLNKNNNLITTPIRDVHCNILLVLAYCYNIYEINAAIIKSIHQIKFNLIH